MKFAPLALAIALALSASLHGADRPYKSPYSVRFSTRPEELIGDLLRGPRADWKDSASVPFREWYNPANQARWGHRGPSSKQYDAPPGLANKPPEWLRQRIIATGLQFVGYTYQHHHVPYWEPPADWPRDDEQRPPGKGLDCSNFTAFVYNLALGIRPTGDIHQQAEMTSAPGPGPNRTTPALRIELPERYDAYDKTLRTGDLLFIKGSSGSTISHVVLWVGSIGHSPDRVPLILDSTGGGNFDSTGAEIPDGIQLRAFTEKSWYARRASHALRLIPDAPEKRR